MIIPFQIDGILRFQPAVKVFGGWFYGLNFVSQIPVWVNQKTPPLINFQGCSRLEDSKSPSFRGLVGKGARFLRNYPLVSYKCNWATESTVFAWEIFLSWEP